MVRIKPHLTSWVTESLSLSPTEMLLLLKILSSIVLKFKIPLLFNELGVEDIHYMMVILDVDLS